MKDEVLLELASRWEKEAVEPEYQDGSPGAKRGNYIDQGHRQAKRECADTLRTLVDMIGGL